MYPLHRRDNQAMGASIAMNQRCALSFRSGLLCLLAFNGTNSVAGTSNWSQVAVEIVAQIDQAESLYRQGEQTEAARAVTRAYFGIFEDRKMEAAMRMELGAKHTYQVEQQFGALRKAIRGDADEPTVQELARGLRESVARDARALDEAQIPMDVFGTNP